MYLKGSDTMVCCPFVQYKQAVVSYPAQTFLLAIRNSASFNLAYTVPGSPPSQVAAERMPHWVTGQY